MKKWVNLIEKILIRCIVLILIVLVLVQGMMTKDSFRFYLSWSEQMEGQLLEFPVSAGSQYREAEPSMQIDSPFAALTISISEYSSLPKANVLINGQPTGNFTEPELNLTLMAGDVVEIDSSYYAFPVEYKISRASENLAYPGVGNSYTGNQGMVMIGKIIVK
ncbi:MAG: hypothetical protein GX550_01980 [Syntrophomonadaceae bacterium]|nr:hypothetical protein [Syntrophomonadaceae bacterium]